MRSLNIEMVGDVITQPFSGLGKCLDGFDVKLRHHDIDQHVQVLMAPSDAEVLILHAGLDYFFRGDSDQAEPLMVEYCTNIAAAAARGSTLLIVNNLLWNTPRMIGMEGIEQAEKVARLNTMLADCARANPMVSIADVASVLSRVGTQHGINAQNGLVMRMPYTQHALRPLVDEYARLIRERFVSRKKVLVLDADNTLWGGIVGEDGVHGIEIDNSFPGIVYRRFQQALLDAKRSGIVLAMVSKNNEADVREVFDKRSMPLSFDDFTIAKINWQPKSQNIAEIANAINVGIDSMVFIDDNPFELEEVRHALPGITAYQFDGRKPDDALSLLARVRDLNSWSLTDEDRVKSALYTEEMKRQSVRHAAHSIEDYIESLGIKLEVGLNRTSQLKRIVQLTNKTNQFNLTTRRYSEAEMLARMDNGSVYDFRVQDRFGDMGIVGVVIVADGEIDTFLMSCRAIGRRVEQQMLRYVCDSEGAPLKALYAPTAKNGIVADFYEKNGFSPISEEGEIRHFEYAGGPKLPKPLPFTRVE